MEATPSFISLLENLNASTSLQDDLNNLKIKANSININSLRDVTRPEQMEVLFKCLDTQNSDQISCACQILERLLMTVDGGDLYSNYADQFGLGLKHPADEVKLLCLRNLIRAVQEKPDEVFSRLDLLKSVVGCVCDDELSISSEAKKIIVILGKLNKYTSLLFSNNIQSCIQRHMESSSIFSYRFYELFVEISLTDGRSRDELFRSPTSLLRGLKHDLDREDDVLLQLNCIELYATLSQVDHGYDFLQSEGIISIMENKMNIYDKNNCGLFLPGILKFFGNLGNRLPEKLVADFPGVVSKLAAFSLDDSEIVTNNYDILQTLALETFGCIGRSDVGKIALKDEIMTAVIKKISYLLIRDPEPKRRVRLLGVLNDLFTCDGEEIPNPVITLLQKWYELLTPRDLTLAAYLQSIVVQPFIDQHTKVLVLMATLCAFDWGRASFTKVVGWQEFLLNRSTESDKYGKELKFAAVATLLKQNRGDLDPSFVTRLRRYAGEGVFYVVPEACVATESA